MLITTAHLFALHELAAGEAAGHAVRMLPEDDSQEPVYRELELQGLVLLAAIRQVGTLYVKEREVRIQPEQWVEVERLTALGPQEFKEAIHVARIGQYIGEANITEAGMDLLAVQAQLNSNLEQEQP
jgi:hypothetical protein